MSRISIFLLLIVLNTVHAQSKGHRKFGLRSNPNPGTKYSFFAPYLGLHTASGEISSTETSSKGYVYGARLGFDSNYIITALDYSTSSITFTEKSVVAEVENDYKVSNIGLIIGTSFIPWFDISFKYIVRSQLEAQTGTDSGMINKGSGHGAIISLKAFHFMLMNIEYNKITYDEFEDPSAFPATGSLVSEIDNTEILFTISIPIQF